VQTGSLDRALQLCIPSTRAEAHLAHTPPHSFSITARCATLAATDLGMLRLDLRAIDITLLAVFAAATWAAYQPHSPLRQLLTLAVAAVGTFIAWISVGPSAWLRSTHVHATAAPGTAIRHVRKPGKQLPCPYPDAWYAVALSAELTPARVLSVTVCNRNLVVWRPRAGAAPVVTDAYCPHLGAHMGLGGSRVENGCIRCPFHGWKFDASGACVEVPGSDTCPGKAAALRTWEAVERNGVVSVWMSSASHKEGAGAYSALVDKSGSGVDLSSSNGELSEPAAGKPALSLAYEHTQAPPASASKTDASSPASGAASLAPWFHIPIVPELESGEWHYAGYTENIVPALLLEIPENGSDVAHLPALHARFIVPGLRWAFSHNWAASWTPRKAPGQGHIADVRISEAIALFGVELPGKVNVSITQVGPSQVFLQMHTPVGRATLIETVTPVSPLELRVLHALYVPRTVPSVFAKALLM